MPSIFLYGGGSKKVRKEAALKLMAAKEIEEGSGLIVVGDDQEKIGIGEVKKLLPHLHVRTKDKQRGVVFLEAQRLTVPAQNALLKILEEPPAHLTFILTAPHRKLLLPTVISRCIITSLQSPEAKHEETTIKPAFVEKLLAAQSGRRLALFEEDIGYSREGIFAFLDVAEARLGKKMSQKNAQRLRRLWEAKNLLRDDSANPKLVVDELLISW
jgi:DNA polymerase III delta prime subunit